MNLQVDERYISLYWKCVQIPCNLLKAHLHITNIKVGAEKKKQQLIQEVGNSWESLDEYTIL